MAYIRIESDPVWRSVMLQDCGITPGKEASKKEAMVISMIIPSELKNKGFSLAIKGYDQQEVDEQIRYIISQYTELYNHNVSLEKRLKIAEEKVKSIKQDEESVKAALINAQKAGAGIIQDANVRAAAVTKICKSNCDKILANYRAQLHVEHEYAEKLCELAENFKKTLYQAYNSQIEQIEKAESSIPELKEITMNEDDLTLEALAAIKKSVSAYQEESVDQYDEEIETEAEMKPLGNDRENLLRQIAQLEVDLERLLDKATSVENKLKQAKKKLNALDNNLAFEEEEVERFSTISQEDPDEYVDASVLTDVAEAEKNSSTVKNVEIVDDDIGEAIGTEDPKNDDRSAAYERLMDAINIQMPEMKSRQSDFNIAIVKTKAPEPEENNDVIVEEFEPDFIPQKSTVDEYQEFGEAEEVTQTEAVDYVEEYEEIDVSGKNHFSTSELDNLDTYEESSPVLDETESDNTKNEGYLASDIEAMLNNIVAKKSEQSISVTTEIYDVNPDSSNDTIISDTSVPDSNVSEAAIADEPDNVMTKSESADTAEPQEKENEIKPSDNNETVEVIEEEEPEADAEIPADVTPKTEKISLEELKAVEKVAKPETAKADAGIAMDIAAKLNSIKTAKKAEDTSFDIHFGDGDNDKSSKRNTNIDLNFNDINAKSAPAKPDIDDKLDFGNIEKKQSLQLPEDEEDFDFGVQNENAGTGSAESYNAKDAEKLKKGAVPERINSVPGSVKDQISKLNTAILTGQEYVDEANSELQKAETARTENTDDSNDDIIEAEVYQELVQGIDDGVQNKQSEEKGKSDGRTSRFRRLFR